jgi:DNA-binding transcriptional LysR family regulator
MRLRHIEVFNAVMLAGSVGAAAKLISISQPAVTKTLQHAEMQLGFQLFSRIKGRLHPTPEALALYQEVRKLYANLEDIRKLAENLKHGGSRMIRIATTNGLSHQVIPNAILQLQDDNPDLNCEILTAGTKESQGALLRRDIDLAFAFDPPEHPGIDQEEVAVGELVCVFARDSAHLKKHFTKQNVTLEDLAKMPFISMGTEDPLGLAFHEACRRADLELKPKIRVRTYHIARSLAESGSGVAVIDQYTAAAGDMRRLAIRPLRPAITFSVKAMWANSAPQTVVGQRLLTHFRSAEKRVAAGLWKSK